jgi:AcrR family transcriptional regulator
MCNNFFMARKYELKARAERQEETRRRIAEAALALHTTIGPARTSVSAIAEKAGVQRHTFYRHFPDELSLQLACSGAHADRHPLPDPEPWTAIADPASRLRAGLAAVYAYFERHERLLANVIRDSELNPVTEEVNAIRFGPWAERVREVLADGLSREKRTQATLDLALDFRTWQRLTRSGLSRDEAVETMVGVIHCQ